VSVDVNPLAWARRTIYCKWGDGYIKPINLHTNQEELALHFDVRHTEDYLPERYYGSDTYFSDVYFNGQRIRNKIDAGTEGSDFKVKLSSGVNTVEVKAFADKDDSSYVCSSGQYIIILDKIPPDLILGLSEPGDSIDITAKSNEALSTPETSGRSLNATVTRVSTSETARVTMAQVGATSWKGIYGSRESPVIDGDYYVTIESSDLAGNQARKTAHFSKRVIEKIDRGKPVTINSGSTSAEIETCGDVSNASISITQHMDNPAGNSANPSGLPKIAAFVEIQVPPEVRDNIKWPVRIEVEYDPAQLPSGTDENTLKLWVWNTASGDWEAVPDSYADTMNKLITGDAYHLSRFGVFGAEMVPGVPSGGPAINPLPVTGLTSATITHFSQMGKMDAAVETAPPVVTTPPVTTLPVRLPPVTMLPATTPPVTTPPATTAPSTATLPVTKPPAASITPASPTPAVTPPGGGIAWWLILVIVLAVMYIAFRMFMVVRNRRRSEEK
jgi:hypothetical protein